MGFADTLPSNEKTDIFLLTDTPNTDTQLLSNINNNTFFLENKTTWKTRAYIEPVNIFKNTICNKKELEIQKHNVTCKDYPCEQIWNIDVLSLIV